VKSDPVSTPRWLLLWTIILAISLLIWTQLEDLSPGRALLFATAVCLTAGIHAWFRSNKNPCIRLWLRYPLGAAGLGFSTPLLAAFFMVFKSGLHGHGFPDYLFEDYLAALALIPLYTVAGLAIGILISVWLWRGCKPGGDRASAG
jgi:hypothetical protein